jgi:aryl-alcohol dehydrogenase-like predicted oxidoreductase
MVQTRRLGRMDIRVTPVAMGCWPITGITSIDVNERDSLATLQAALDAGINFFARPTPTDTRGRANG